jgi:hypothetical protein
VEAERLARAGSHAEALRRFQVLAAANPDDVQFDETSCRSASASIGPDEVAAHHVRASVAPTTIHAYRRSSSRWCGVSEYAYFGTLALSR